jgi:sugar phosphate isomerase/epimerase
MSDIRVYAFSDEASADIDSQIKALIRNNLQGMEIRNVDGTNVSDITTQKAKEVKNKLDANGLCIWSVGSPIGKISITDDFGKHLDKFRHTLEIAKILDSHNIRLFSFYTPKRKNPDDYKNEVIDRLGQFCQVAKEYDIVLCHENEKGIYGDTTERCLEIHKALPDIKGVFDPANFVQCGINTLKAWEMLKDYVYYMHIKDALPSGFVVPAGKGTGNVQTIVQEYISLGGSNFTIEPHLIAFKGLKFLERIGEKRQISYKYSDSNTAFDVACNSFKDLL